LNELKEVLFLTWDHGKDKEHTRMNALKALYDGILSNCKSIFGTSAAQDEVIKKLNGFNLQDVSAQLYSFKALISEEELKQLIQINDLYGGGVDFMKATDEDIKNLIKKVEFEKAPESNLIVKQSIMKRESGAFARFKDATAILTRDK